MRKGGEIGTACQLSLERGRLFLGFHKDMGGIVFGGLRLALEPGVVGGLQCLFGDRCFNDRLMAMPET